MKNITPELIEKYFNKSCSEEERKIVEAWLNSDKEESPHEEMYIRESWQKIQDKALSESKQDAAGKSSVFKSLIGVAASLLLVIFGGIYAYNTFLSNTENEGQHAEIQYKNISTTRGQKRVLNLPDGSTITLNFESEIKIPERFSDTLRVVYLTGHAHFDVARDTERPFIIYTHHSKTQVLGTSFDIKTFPDSEKTEIVVASGSVEFSQKDKGQNIVRLTVNDKAILLPGKEIEVGEVNAGNLTAWKDNRILFENATLEEIVKVLERWYDIEITVKNPVLLRKKYTFSYDNPSLETLMKRMSFVAKFKYSIEGKQVTIF